jgi:hypothetical protein
MTKVYVFVAILSWSRTLFLRFTTDIQLLTWLDCHRRAFEHFGGVTREVLIDNLKRSSDFRVGRREIEPTEVKEDRPLEAVGVAVASRSVLDELDLAV